MQVKFIVRRALALLVLSVVTAGVYSQTVSLKGKLADKTDNTIIAGATVQLTSQRDSSFSKTLVTDSKGLFQFDDLQPSTYTVKIAASGYEKIEQKIALQATNKTTIPFSLTKLATELAGVVIISKTPPVKQKGDTSEFNASQFKVNPDATAEDMIKKLPGLTVAKDGTITTMGEQVKKVTVDGKDFFGDDATAALRNLPADIIDKIQVFDKLSDQAALTGFDDGNSVKTVNIVTKSGIKNGQFGRVYAGAGTEGRYSAGGNMSFFKGDRRLSVVGNFNNINLQNFSTQDLLGVTSGSGGGGRGGGGRGGGGFGGQDNFNVGQSSGISKTNSFGLNFSNVYNKKLTLTGSYFFNNSTNTNSSLSNTATTIGDSILHSVQNSTSTATNTNHRINMRLEYKIDSANSLFIIPSLSFQKNNSQSFSNTQNFYNLNDSTSSSLSNNTADRNGYNLKNNILFRHSFKKRGRTLSFGFNTAWTKNDGTGISDASYRFYKPFVTDSTSNIFTDNTSTGTTIGGNIAYTEPLSKKAMLQIDYTPSVQKNKADQQTFRYDGQKYSLFDTSQSNRFDNTITTNNVGLNYRLGKSRDEQLSFGVNFQTSKLESQRTFPTATSVNQTFSNVLPNLMWRKKLSNVSNIRVFYRASVSFPSINQLQDVVNLSNPLSVSSGNPNLKQSYTHFLTGRYTYTNSKTSTSFFANILLQTASDYITTAIYIPRTDSIIQQNIKLKANSQFSKPVNLDGYNSLRTFFTYSMPLKFIKTTMNVNAGFSYGKTPGMVNYLKTKTDAYAYNTGVVLASNISEFVDFNISYSANFNNSSTVGGTSNSTNKYVNQVAGAQVNLLDKKGWFIQNDITGNSYTGLSAGLNQSFWLWNASIGKKILAKQAGEIKLSVFDLLKQNQSISRTITGPVTQDIQTQVLQQYFMLTFTYKLKNFGVAATRQNNGGGFGGNRGGFGGPPPGGGPGGPGF